MMAYDMSAFMRQNRRAWFSSALTLLLPWSLLLGLSAFTPSDDEIGTEGLFFEMLFKWKGDSAPFFFPVLFIGVWMAYVHVYVLLTTYDERGEAINRLTQRQLWPAYWRMALRSSWLAVRPNTPAAWMVMTSGPRKPLIFG